MQFAPAYVDRQPLTAEEEAYKFLLDLRIDEGPMSEDEATRRLLDWWSARSGGR